MNLEKQSTNLQMTLREVNRVGEGQKNVPKLRFKGYEDAWEQRKFGEISQRVQGNDGRMNLPTLTISAAYGWMDQIDRFSGNIAGTEQKNYTLLKKGELSYNHGNSKLAKYGAVFELSTYEEALVPKVYHSFRMIKGDSKFIEFLFATKLPDRELSKLISSGARMDGLLNITYSDFATINLTVPSEAEQNMVSNCLKALDDLLTLHQRKYDALKSMKKILLSKMFPKNGEDVPEIRFKEFTDAWEQRKLGEVSQIVGGGTPSTGIPEYWDGDIDWYSPVEIGEEIFVSCSQRKITQLGLEKSSAKILPEGTVLFTSRAGIGNTAILEKEGCTNQGFQSIVPKDNELDSYFIFSCSHLLKKYGETKGAGSTFVEISGKQMSLMPLNIPEIKEQKSVGNFFRKLDSIITLHQRKLEELKNMKKTLLQQMFV